MGINLKSFVFPPTGPDYSAAKILKEVSSKLDSKEYQQKTGLVTSGFINATQGTGGNSWAVSDLIQFPYEYTERPIFTWGQEGSYSGDLINTNPYDIVGGNTYSLELPSPLTDYIADEDFTTFSPAIFIPRIIHWYKRSPLTWSGCYLLVFQVNSICTELEGKVCRVHFRFEGSGYLT